MNPKNEQVQINQSFISVYQISITSILYSLYISKFYIFCIEKKKGRNALRMTTKLLVQ